MSENVQEDSHVDALKALLCEILEIEPEELREDASFFDDYNADSLTAVEILAAMEKQFSVKIPESELENMNTMRQTMVVLDAHGWRK